MGILDRWRRQRRGCRADSLTKAIQGAIDEWLAEGSISSPRKKPEDDDDQTNWILRRAVQVYWRLTREPRYRHLAG